MANSEKTLCYPFPNWNDFQEEDRPDTYHYGRIENKDNKDSDEDVTNKNFQERNDVDVDDSEEKDSNNNRTHIFEEPKLQQNPPISNKSVWKNIARHIFGFNNIFLKVQQK